MCGSCSKTEMGGELENTAKEISLEEIEGKRYSPLRFHAETFRHMDDLRGVFEDLLLEMKRLRFSCDGFDLDWVPKTTVDAERWPL